MGRRRNTDKKIGKVSFNVAGAVSQYLQYRLQREPHKNLTEILTEILVKALRSDPDYLLEQKQNGSKKEIDGGDCAARS